MKKRVFNMLNFFAFNVLFFAIYLNFIHKDVNTLPSVSASAAATKTAKNFTAAQLEQTAPVNETEKQKSAAN